MTSLAAAFILAVIVAMLWTVGWVADSTFEELDSAAVRFMAQERHDKAADEVAARIEVGDTKAVLLEELRRANARYTVRQFENGEELIDFGWHRAEVVEGRVVRMVELQPAMRS